MIGLGVTHEHLDREVDEVAAATGRDGNDIERSVHWFGEESADAGRQAGATMLTTAIAPTPSPVMTSAPWRQCWPGVTLRSEGGLCSRGAGDSAANTVEDLDAARSPWRSSPACGLAPTFRRDLRNVSPGQAAQSGFSGSVATHAVHSGSRWATSKGRNKWL